MAESPVTFAGLLRKLRREARLTQEELAEAAGVSVRAVAYLERGTLTVFRRIGAAEAAGLTAELSAVDHEAVDPPGRPWGHRTRTEGVKPE